MSTTEIDAEVQRLRFVLDRVELARQMSRQRKLNRLGALYIALVRSVSPEAAAQCRARWEVVRPFVNPPSEELIAAMAKHGLPTLEPDEAERLKENGSVPPAHQPASSNALKVSLGELMRPK
jgi:hypothetical protein